MEHKMKAFKIESAYQGIAEEMFVWTVKLTYDGREMNTPYSMGFGHCSRKKTSKSSNIQERVGGSAKLARAIKPFGRLAVDDTTGSVWLDAPQLRDVLHSLQSDASAPLLFEDFCSEFGYDTDSRKAESTHRACLRIRGELERMLGADYEEFMKTNWEDEADA
jgi:hypothetical protein